MGEGDNFLACLLTTNSIRCVQEDEWLHSKYEEGNVSFKSITDFV
jgi:hypothetical protein